MGCRAEMGLSARSIMRSCWQALRPCGSPVRALWFSRSSRKAVQPCAHAETCQQEPYRSRRNIPALHEAVHFWMLRPVAYTMAYRV